MTTPPGQIVPSVAPAAAAVAAAAAPASASCEALRLAGRFTVAPLALPPSSAGVCFGVTGRLVAAAEGADGRLFAGVTVQPDAPCHTQPGRTRSAPTRCSMPKGS